MTERASLVMLRILCIFPDLLKKALTSAYRIDGTALCTFCTALTQGFIDYNLLQFAQAPAGQRFSRMCASYSSLKYSIVLITSRDAVFPVIEMWRTRCPQAPGLYISSSPCPDTMRSKWPAFFWFPLGRAHFRRIRSGEVHEKPGHFYHAILSSMTTRPPEPIIAPAF